MALMNQLGDKTKSIKRPEIPTNRIKPKADVKTATDYLNFKVNSNANAVKSTKSALDGVRRNMPDARKPISDEVSKFKNNGSKQEPHKNVFEYQDLVRIEHSGLGNSPEIADERKPFRINIERAQKESDDFEKRLSNAKMDLFDSNGNLIDYKKQVSDIDNEVSNLKEQFKSIKDTDGNNDLKFNLLGQIQELEVKKNPLEDMAELQNEYASYASYQNALHSGNDEDLRKASYDLSAYNDSFFERRLYALGRTANNMVASAVTLADILRDVGGEIAGNSVEYNARSLIEEAPASAAMHSACCIDSSTA